MCSISSLVYCMRTENVVSVMCNGKWIMKDKKILNVNEVFSISFCSLVTKWYASRYSKRAIAMKYYLCDFLKSVFYKNVQDKVLCGNKYYGSYFPSNIVAKIFKVCLCKYIVSLNRKRLFHWQS